MCLYYIFCICLRITGAIPLIRRQSVKENTDKYIIRSYEPFIEEKAKTFMQALSVIKKMKVSGIKHYEVIRIPFRERHPNFPIYFSIAVLVIVMLSG